MQFTKEQLTERARRKVKELEFAITQIAFTSIRDGLKEELELARIALAALTAEPVAYNQVQRDIMKDIIVRKLGGNLLGDKLMMADIHAVTMALIQAGFRTAPPASERERIRREHAEWSDKTFGDVGPIGPLKHLSKEALETAAEPDDLSEWADMQFLFWDAQRRAGITDEQITRALTEKLAINKARQWPELKDGEPRLHIKEQPASVIPAAWYDIMSERLRQIHMEGWEPEHDDTYDGGELAGAAACYARHVSARGWVYAENPAAYQDEDVPGDWPWAEEWWKPTSPYRDLEKAGALILAEMERINRATGAGEGGTVVGEVSRG